MADIQYKIYQAKADGQENVFFYDNKATAQRAYNRMLHEKVPETVWAELLSTDYDVEDADWEVLEMFERRTVEILGHRLVLPDILRKE